MRRSATRRSGSTTSVRASTCRSGSLSSSTRIRPHGPFCWSATASSRGASTSRGGLPEHYRVRHQSRRGGGRGRSRPVRPWRQGERGARGERVPHPPGADPPRAPRLASRRRGRRRPRGRPERGRRRIRLVGSGLRGESGRRALPRSSDQHEAQAARRRVRPGDRRRRRARCGSTDAGWTSTARGTAGTTKRTSTTRRGQFPMDPVGPRVVLIPGVGVVTSGLDAGKARTTRDLYHRAIVVEDAAEALGGFRSLSEEEAFAIEYWPLERYKLAQAPPPGELSGRVAVITGGASGIGRATARLLGVARRARRRRRPERRRRPRGRRGARRGARRPARARRRGRRDERGRGRRR